MIDLKSGPQYNFNISEDRQPAPTVSYFYLNDDFAKRRKFVKYNCPYKAPRKQNAPSQKAIHRQECVFKWIEAYIKKQGIGPLQTEIREGVLKEFDLKVSQSQISESIHALVNLGKLTMSPVLCRRNIGLVPPPVAAEALTPPAPTLLLSTPINKMSVQSLLNDKNVEPSLSKAVRSRPD